MRKQLLFAAAALLAAPTLAQTADKPLGEILDAIADAEQADAAPPPVPRTGIGSAELPPSAIEPLAGGQFPEEPVELTEEQERLAELDAAERRRTQELNRAVTERHEDVRRRNEEARLAYEREAAAAEAEAERATAAYRAEVERVRRQAARERALWEAQVRACRAGDLSQCARD